MSTVSSVNATAAKLSLIDESGIDDTNIIDDGDNDIIKNGDDDDDD